MFYRAHLSASCGLFITVLPCFIGTVYPKNLFQLKFLKNLEIKTNSSSIPSPETKAILGDLNITMFC